MLNQYIDFNIKYKIVVNNKLPPEFKKYIRDIYIKIIATDIIKKFVSNYISVCLDCNKRIYYNNSKYINACRDIIFGNISCCRKVVCKNGCTFTLKCGHEFKINNVNKQSNPHIELNCNVCSHKEIKKLCWYGSR